MPVVFDQGCIKLMTMGEYEFDVGINGGTSEGLEHTEPIARLALIFQIERLTNHAEGRVD